MVWSTHIDEVIKDRDALVVRVTLVEGAVKVRPDEYRVTSELELKQRINSDIARLSLSGTELPKIVVGDYDPAITPPPLTTKQKYQLDLTLFNQMKRAAALDLGLIDAGSQTYTDQAAKVKTGFDLSYLDLF